jgi:hypothetical protein
MESRMANGGGMIWAKRFYELGTPYTPEFKRFEKDFIIRGGPPDMLMIKARSHKPRGDIVFIRLIQLQLVMAESRRHQCLA